MVLNFEYAVLVYQAGIANVFKVEAFNVANFGRNAERIVQADFRACENFARGLATAGVVVASAYCNMAGEITNQKWSDQLPDMPFFESAHPVFNGVVKPY